MNKRPLPCVLAGFVLGEVWMWQFHGTVVFTALCLAAIICFIIGVLRKGSFFILLSLGLLLGGVRTQEWNFYKNGIEFWMNRESKMISGQIEDVTKNEYSYSIIIGNLQIEDVSQGGRLLIYLDEEPECFIGSRIILDGFIEKFELPANPGGFNLRTYREGKGILGFVADAKVMEVRVGSFLIKDVIYDIREKSIDYIKKYMDEKFSGIAIAMAFGNKEFVQEEEKSLYEFGGISHVLAVSGLHMSLLGASVYKLLRKVGFGYTVSVCASMPCIFLYAVMTGMSSSCLRAGIMLCIYLFAEWKGYYYDLPSALSLAALWLLYEIPARLFDSGFLLSFGAMISVGVLCPFLFRMFRYKTGTNKIKDSFFSGLIITIFTMPLSLYFFYGFSVAGLVLNLIVIPLMTFLVPLLFIGGMGWMPFIPDFAAGFCFTAGEWILQLYNRLCSLTRKFPLSYIQTGYRGFGFLLCYYVMVILFLFVLLWAYKKKKKLIYLLIPIMLGLLFIFIKQTGKKEAYLTMLDVGQGDGILYHTVAGEVCMIDGGSTSERKIGRYVISPALEYYGIDKVDYWFVSHFDEDHTSGLKELLELGYPVSNLILPARKDKGEKQMELEELAFKNRTKVYYMKQGDKLKLKNSILYCLYPKKNNTGDENQNSMVLLLDTSCHQILLTGDVEKEGETNMIKELKKYRMIDSKEQILKVGHHGSANGTKEELLKAFQPDSALISCALDNGYGHPAKETVERIKRSKANIYYTMKHGAIEIQLGKETSYLGYGVIE